MKHIIFGGLAIIGLSIFLSLKDQNKINIAELGEALSVRITADEVAMGNVDIRQSNIQWKGYNASGGSHTGTIEILPSSILIGSTGKLNSAAIQLDMNTITSTDLDGDMADKLVNHLKSSDFFFVEMFPKASVEIIELNDQVPTDNVLEGANQMAIGNLYIRNKVKSIKFPVKLSYEGDSVTINSELKFDRTAFDVNYGADESLKDKMIEKNVTLNLHIKGLLTSEATSAPVDAANE